MRSNLRQVGDLSPQAHPRITLTIWSGGRIAEHSLSIDGEGFSARAYLSRVDMLKLRDLIDNALSPAAASPMEKADA